MHLGRQMWLGERTVRAMQRQESEIWPHLLLVGAEPTTVQGIEEMPSHGRDIGTPPWLISALP